MTTLALNSAESIQPRLAAGRIPSYGPLLMLVARSAFILLAQGITFLIFLQLRVPDAAVLLRNWWPVYRTLVDLDCLGLMFWLTKREGIGLRDLIGLDKSKLKTEIPLGLGMWWTDFRLRRILSPLPGSTSHSGRFLAKC